eukprot:9469607-Pyramimonas_sp.AAC.1
MPGTPGTPPGPTGTPPGHQRTETDFRSYFGPATRGSRAASPRPHARHEHETETDFPVGGL